METTLPPQHCDREALNFTQRPAPDLQQDSDEFPTLLYGTQVFPEFE